MRTHPLWLRGLVCLSFSFHQALDVDPPVADADAEMTEEKSLEEIAPRVEDAAQNNRPQDAALVALQVCRLGDEPCYTAL